MASEDLASGAHATTLATLAMDELMYLRPASRASDFARPTLAAGLPLESHRGEGWAILALGAGPTQRT